MGSDGRSGVLVRRRPPNRWVRIPVAAAWWVKSGHFSDLPGQLMCRPASDLTPFVCTRKHKTKCARKRSCNPCQSSVGYGNTKIPSMPTQRKRSEADYALRV
ncbi:hypothetical protein V1264_017629 [Littorina saxatilis]|uniref:Uncharacterized protein n=1 Tax=Littorina saxatilis TaxID=31220 RepID=A0AAN9BJK5_9CAEN